MNGDSVLLPGISGALGGGLGIRPMDLPRYALLVFVLVLHSPRPAMAPVGHRMQRKPRMVDFLEAVTAANGLQDMCKAPVTGKMCCCSLRFKHRTPSYEACAGPAPTSAHYSGDAGNLNLFIHGGVALNGIPAPSRQSLVIDVGAAYGNEALIALQAGYSVVSMEARADEASRLRGIVNQADPHTAISRQARQAEWAVYAALGQYTHNRTFTLVQAAAGKQAGVAKLAMGSDSSSLSKEAVDTTRQAVKQNRQGQVVPNVGHRGWHQLGAPLTALDYQMGELVPVVTVDEVVAVRHQQGGTNRVAVLKIDVQGYENDVLLGAVRTLEQDHPAVVFEVEAQLFEGHDPYLPVRMLVDQYNYTCFSPWRATPCLGSMDHICMWSPLLRTAAA